MKLNPQYKSMLESTFGADLSHQIEEAYNLESVHGYRMNSLKMVNPFENDIPSPLNSDVYLPNQYSRLVTHPFHHAGGYYIQDPSASMPVVALNLQPTDRVLDLCAAPGGKSTYILTKISEGFLVANEVDSKRNQKLCHNFDRWGHENVVVIQNSTEQIAKALPNSFDKVLLDAPCSGEGLFRRDPEFALEYQPQNAMGFAKLQKELLEDAYQCVKDGGTLVYSTCTLNLHENEGVIKHFLENHPECSLIPLNLPEGREGYEDFGKSVTRYFPSADAEGHFIAALKIHKHESENELTFKPFKESSFDFFDRKIEGHFISKGDFVYGLKNRGAFKSSLNIKRDGVLMGVMKKKHFDYDHALSQSVSFKNDFESIELSLEDAYRYLYGHPINTPIKGIHCVTYNGLSLGFVKGDGKRGNNRYPKGLRNRFEDYSY